MNDVWLILLAQLPTLIGLFLLWGKASVNAANIRNGAAQVDVDKGATAAAKDALIVALAAKTDDLYEKQYAGVLREVAAAKENTASIAALTVVQSKLDTALADLTVVRAQLKLANEQITRLLQLQPTTTALDHETNLAADRASGQTVPQEVPPLPNTPGPVGAVDSGSGEIVKVAA